MTVDVRETDLLAQILLELRAIRREIEVHALQVGVCDHGNSGICMSCLIPIIERSFEGLRR